MGYNLAGSPFNLATVGTGTLSINTTNLPQGCRLWLVNDSPFTLNLSGDIAPGTSILHPAQYSREYPVNPMQNEILINIIAGSAALAFSTLLHIWVSLPNDPSVNDKNNQGASRYPFSQNFGFQPNVPNGGIVAAASRAKAALAITPPLQQTTVYKCDSLDFNNVIFYDHFTGINVTASGTFNFIASASDCGVPYGRGSTIATGAPGYWGSGPAGAVFYTSSWGLGAAPVLAGQVTIIETLFPAFNFPINPSAIEMNGHLTSQIGRACDLWVHFFLNPLVVFSVRVSTTTPSTTITCKATQLPAGTNIQTFTFTAAVASFDPTTNAACQCGIKALFNSSTGTYDIYCRYGQAAGIVTLPTVNNYVFVGTLSNAFFASLLGANLVPGMGLSNSSPSLQGTSYSWGGEAVDANGFWRAAIQMNVP